MKELVRCRPCGYVIEEDKLGDVCPACGMPRKVFEPYRERVSLNRLLLLNFDLHPIAIHLSQALVITIPLLTIITNISGNFYPELLKNVLIFSVVVFPLTLVLAIITGIIDGLTRFKTLITPLIIRKIFASSVILVLSVILLFVAPYEHFGIFTIGISLVSLATGIQLGLWGKKLINVILPGTYPQKKGTKVAKPKEEAEIGKTE
jgi:rubredoxin